MRPEFMIRKDAPFEFYEVDILNASEDTLVQISEYLALGLSKDEMIRIRDHFSTLGRNPTDLELQALGQAWSEHACYKSSKIHLKKHLIDIDNGDVISRGDAGVMRFHGPYVYSLRIESHNHPSAIEPYGGAATGIGGIVRDVLAMGTQPMALVDPLFFGPLDMDYSSLPKGIKHPRFLFSGVVAGIRDYGNRLGIPTVAGAVYFDPDYTGNCLVNVGCLGYGRVEHVMPNRVSNVGDLFVLIGGRTGRDGIHGVTFASAELTEDSEEESRSAVQVGDPITEEPVIHATLAAIRQGLVEGVKDLGGGGLSCVIGEMALAAGYGAEVNLDAVPLKEENMLPWEIWISESQERMMLAVREENLQKVLDICEMYDVEANVVGKVIKEKKLIIWYHGIKVAESSLDFIYDAPVYNRPYTEPLPEKRARDIPPPKDIEIGELLREIESLVGDLNIASKSWVIRQYDHEVRGATALKPLHGLVWHPTHGDASIMKPFEDLSKGLAIALGLSPAAAKIDPYRAGKLAMDEMVRNLVAVGARPHSFSNCLNMGNPEKPDRMGEFVATVRGMGEVARTLGIPTPSGNVSFYNESPKYKVPPTAVVMGAGIVDDLNHVISAEFKLQGSHIYHVGPLSDAMGGSTYYRIHGYSSPRVPDVDPHMLRKAMEGMLEAIHNDAIVSAHDISDGGLAIAIMEMAFGSHLGAIVDIDSLPGRRDVRLFSEGPTRWIVEVPPEKEAMFLDVMKKHDVPVYRIGMTTEEYTVDFRSGGKTAVIDIPHMYRIWESRLWEMM